MAKSSKARDCHPTRRPTTALVDLQHVLTTSSGVQEGEASVVSLTKWKTKTFVCRVDFEHVRERDEADRQIYPVKVLCVAGLVAGQRVPLRRHEQEAFARRWRCPTPGHLRYQSIRTAWLLQLMQMAMIE
jgi:hypothetical protein